MKSLKESLLLERLVPCKKRAENDQYLQDMWSTYIHKNSCNDAEWAQAGMNYAQDCLDNGEIDDEEFLEMMDYYTYYEY